MIGILAMRTFLYNDLIACERQLLSYTFDINQHLYGPIFFNRYVTSTPCDRPDAVIAWPAAHLISDGLFCKNQPWPCSIASGVQSVYPAVLFGQPVLPLPVSVNRFGQPL